MVELVFWKTTHTSGRGGDEMPCELCYSKTVAWRIHKAYCTVIWIIMIFSHVLSDFIVIFTRFHLLAYGFFSNLWYNISIIKTEHEERGAEMSV